MATDNSGWMYFITMHRALTLTFILSLELITTHSNANHHHISSKYMMGTQPDRRHLYQITNDQTFNCLDGSGSIPMDYVNDDYCDCRDASDEPGTSACFIGRFFCQNEGYIQKLISSSWVNDGQCDCCDASDEYNSTARCENTCGILGENYRREQEKYREMADKGSALRTQYKEEARKRREQNTQLLDQYRRELSEKENAIKKLEEELGADFGPASVYLPLKGKCFNFNDHEYTYTLCPYERATQESSGMQTELGRWSGYAGPEGDPYSAHKYEGGIQCWNGPARSALVKIACGVEDRIVSVVEPSKCEYVYEFISPAACPDSDPPEEITQTPVDQATTSDLETVTSNLEVEEDQQSYSLDDVTEATEDHSLDQENHDEL